MSKNPLLDSGAQSSKTYRLKPALAAALASLEVQLDQELARYRRTRHGQRTTSQPLVGRFTSSQPQQLTAINTLGGKTQSSVEDSLEDELEKFGTATTKTAPTDFEQEDFSVPETTINTPPQEITDHQQVPTSAHAAETSPSEAVRSTSTHVSSAPELEDSIPLDSAKTKTAPASNSVSLVPASVKKHKNAELSEPDKTPDETNKQPDDYLESSEALLRSLTEEQPKTQKQTNSNDSLLSPLGIGSMLLLLVASMTLGYVIFNPKVLPQLGESGLFKQNTPTANPDNTKQDVNKATSVAQPSLTPIPKYPNLATDEFPEVRDPNDVVGLQPKPKPTLRALPNPIPPQNPTFPTTQARQPLPQPTLVPIPTATIPSPQPSSIQQKPKTEIEPSADGFYHLITDYRGEDSFASARKVVPDAYLSPDGTLIYLGALKNKEKAQQLLQQLQAKGIKARIEQSKTGM